MDKPVKYLELSEPSLGSVQRVKCLSLIQSVKASKLPAFILSHKKSLLRKEERTQLNAQSIQPFTEFFIQNDSLIELVTGSDEASYKTLIKTLNEQQKSSMVYVVDVASLLHSKELLTFFKEEARGQIYFFAPISLYKTIKHLKLGKERVHASGDSVAQYYLPFVDQSQVRQQVFSTSQSAEETASKLQAYLVLLEKKIHALDHSIDAMLEVKLKPLYGYVNHISSITSTLNSIEKNSKQEPLACQALACKQDIVREGLDGFLQYLKTAVEKGIIETDVFHIDAMTKILQNYLEDQQRGAL